MRQTETQKHSGRHSDEPITMAVSDTIPVTVTATVTVVGEATYLSSAHPRTSVDQTP